jgi:hypothetical protein
MGEAAWGAAANAAVGIGTAVMANSAASDQEEYMQSLVNQGQGNRELIESIDRYFLGGGRAAEYDIPGFSDQFGQLDFMREEQEKMIDDEVRDSQQMIEDTMPDGGSKLRALAELSIKSQDAKNTVNREYEAKKNDLDVNLTDKYLQGAMGRQNGVPYGTQYAYGMQSMMNSQNMMAGIGQGMGRLATELGRDRSKQMVEYYPKESLGAEPVSSQGTIKYDYPGSSWGSGSAWSGLDDYGLE